MQRLIKTKEELERIRTSGKILAEVLQIVKAAAIEGVSLKELDTLAFNETKKRGAKPAFLNYKPEGADHGFPATICASLNGVVVHGVPTEYKLKNGDVFKLDMGVNYRGGFSDSATTIAIGKVSPKIKHLMTLTEESLLAGIDAARGGNTVGDIGYAIWTVINENGAKVIKGLTGHGVGNAVHEDPTIFNFGTPHQGMVLRPGMVIALEPMASLTCGDIVQLQDESYGTRDGSISAHYEHTLIITDGAPEVVTMLV